MRVPTVSVTSAPFLGSEAMPRAGSPGVATMGRCCPGRSVHAAVVVRPRVGHDHLGAQRGDALGEVPPVRRSAIQLRASCRRPRIMRRGPSTRWPCCTASRARRATARRGRPAELHDAVERVLALGVGPRMCSITSLACHPGAACRQLEADRLGHRHEREARVDEPAYSVAPTPHASALLPPPMQVWLSVAWMKSPGSTNCSRATWWQMPGETPSLAPSSRARPCGAGTRAAVAQRLDLGRELGHALGTPSA
jgi:hypothetical protein